MASCYRVGSEIRRQQYWSNGVGPSFDNEGLCGTGPTKPPAPKKEQIIHSTCPWASPDAPSVSNLAQKAHRGPLNLPTKRQAPEKGTAGNETWDLITQRKANVPVADPLQKGLGAGICKPMEGGVPFAVGANLAAEVPSEGPVHGEREQVRRQVTKEKGDISLKPNAQQINNDVYKENRQAQVFGRNAGVKF